MMIDDQGFPGCLRRHQCPDACAPGPTYRRSSRCV